MCKSWLKVSQSFLNDLLVSYTNKQHDNDGANNEGSVVCFENHNEGSK